VQHRELRPSSETNPQSGAKPFFGVSSSFDKQRRKVAEEAKEKKDQK